MSDSFQYDFVDEDAHRLAVVESRIRDLEQNHLTTKMALEQLPDEEGQQQNREDMASQLSTLEKQITELRAQRTTLLPQEQVQDQPTE